MLHDFGSSCLCYFTLSAIDYYLFSLYPDYYILLCKWKRNHLYKVTHALFCCHPRCPCQWKVTAVPPAVTPGFPLAVIAVVSSTHLCHPSCIWHNNAPMPVWPCDTNEIGIWKSGTTLWHGIVAGALQELWPEYSQEDLCPSWGQPALPARWGAIAHTLQLMEILAAECSNPRTPLCLSCHGGVLQFKAMIYDLNILLWCYWLSQRLHSSRSGYLGFWHAQPLWAAVS